jgi:hypothetical protein
VEGVNLVCHGFLAVFPEQDWAPDELSLRLAGLNLEIEVLQPLGYFTEDTIAAGPITEQSRYFGSAV